MSSGWRIRWRRLNLGLATLFGRPRGFFIPYRYAATIPATRPAYPALERLFGAEAPAFAQRLAALAGHAAEFAAIGTAAPPAPRWNQSWFPRLDAAMAYAMVRSGRPRRIVEIGSGHSTRFLARAVLDSGLATEIVALDPAPRASLSGLPIRFIPQPLTAADLAPFAALEAGDILFIDSSHILMPGTDVDILFNRVLPELAPGVIVHIHDILLPDDYPADWAWRGYNEQQGVAALLQGGAYTPLFSSHYAVTRMSAEVAASAVATLPRPAEARETSLWLRKR